MPDANLYTAFYVSVEHLAIDPTNANTEGFTSDLSLQAVSCNIQPTSAEMTAMFGGAYGKVYTLYTTSSGILETDRLTTASGTMNPVKQYIVKGKQYYNYGVAGAHTELLCEEVV
jgi:hypothetical protein